MSKQTDLINIPDVITVSGSNVGIGVSPSYTLDVYKSSVGNVARFNSTSGNRSLDITSADNGAYLGAEWDRNINSAGGIHTWSVNDTERMRIDSDGLKFHGDTAAANALNDYEEGTFTPVVEFGGGNTGITYNARSGFYTKIGNVVYFYAECQLSARGTSTGNLAIRDLPFSPQRTATSTSVLTGNLSSTSDIQIFISTNGKINFENRNTGTQSSLTHNNVNSTSTFFVSGTYQTAS